MTKYRKLDRTDWLMIVLGVAFAFVWFTYLLTPWMEGR